MKKISTITLIIASACSATKTTAKQDPVSPKYMNITAADLKTHLYIVAADSMEGRETGSRTKEQENN
jgi:hypothetical protein